MQSIPKDPYFEFNPNTLQEIRKEFNLHKPGDIEEVLKNFQEWLDKQSHFVKKDFNPHFLECSLMQAKGSLERAKKNLDRLCTLKTLVPKFFSKHNVKNDLMDLSNFLTPSLSPKLTNDNYRVFMNKVITSDIDTAMFSDYYRFVILMCEYMKAHDYTQGMVCVTDIRDINVLSFAMRLNVVDLRALLAVLVEGYGMRIKGIYFISESKAVDTLISVLKQILSEKLAARIKVHRTLDSLHADVSKETLSEDFGGPQKPVKELYKEMVELYSTEQNVEYFKEICQPGTDEAYRLTTKFNDEILGMPGSFRTLQVD